MKSMKFIFLLLMTFTLSNAFAGNRKLAGSWTRVAGDYAWGRIDIDESLNAKGYRTCNQVICGDPVAMRLTSYGKNKLSISHTRATGTVVDSEKTFTATEFLEEQDGKLIVREYQKSNITGYPSLMYTMVMAKGRR